MNLGTKTKQPREKTPYTIDLTDSLAEGDYLPDAPGTVEVITTDPALIIDQITILSPRIRFRVSGGTDRTTVKVTLLITTADGTVFDDDITFKIREN